MVRCVGYVAEVAEARLAEISVHKLTELVPLELTELVPLVVKGSRGTVVRTAEV